MTATISESDTIAIRTAAASTRIVHSLETSAWILRHQGEMYALRENDAVMLAHYLVVDVVARAVVAAGEAHLVSADGQLTVNMNGPAGFKLIEIDCSAAEIATPVVFDPELWPDAWAPTRFKITMQGLTQLQLRAYLPEGTDLPPKGYSVKRGGELVATGELARGIESVITIESNGKASSWDDVSIELGYPEPPAGNDERDLGVILVGIDKTPGCAFRTSP